MTPSEKNRLLPKYWGAPQRQIETFVVLGMSGGFRQHLRDSVTAITVPRLKYFRGRVLDLWQTRHAVAIAEQAVSVIGFRNFDNYRLRVRVMCA